MRKYLAMALAVVLIAAAFFLPGQLSAWNDRLLLDEVHLWQEEEREGFAESVRLLVGEKLLLLRSGSLEILGLSGEEVSQGTFIRGDIDVNISFLLEDDLEAKAGGESVYLEASTGDEELTRKWRDRLAAVQGELRTLQAMGGLPALWSADSEVSYTGYGEMLYIDRTTQISFQVYRVNLVCAPYSLQLTVDAQSGRILSFRLQGPAPNWGLRGASNFGSAWRDYWGLDSINNGWYTEYIRTVLEEMEETLLRDGPYNANAQIGFLYDSQTLNIPLINWVYSGEECVLAWNS